MICSIVLNILKCFDYAKRLKFKIQHVSKEIIPYHLYHTNYTTLKSLYIRLLERVNLRNWFN